MVRFVDFLPRDRALREAGHRAVGRDAEASEARVNADFSRVPHARLPTAVPCSRLQSHAVRKLEAVRRDFVANVSHELRTPLTVIRDLSRLTGRTATPELRAQFWAWPQRTCSACSGLVDDLLDLSALNGGRLPTRAKVDVRSRATEICSLRKAAAAKSVSLDICIGEGAENAYIDSTAVRQILSNLAENALRHTATGSVQVFTARDGDGVWIGVRDTGSGIGAEHLERIFERFYRADPSLRVSGGDRLGLAL